MYDKGTLIMCKPNKLEVDRSQFLTTVSESDLISLQNKSCFIKDAAEHFKGRMVMEQKSHDYNSNLNPLTHDQTFMKIEIQP